MIWNDDGLVEGGYEAEHCVTKVTILNRSECCAERLRGSIIRVGSTSDHSNNAQCGSAITSAPAGGWAQVICDEPIRGRFISVQVNGGISVGTLTMCEIRAYEDTCPTTTVATTTKLMTTTEAQAQTTQATTNMQATTDLLQSTNLAVDTTTEVQPDTTEARTTTIEGQPDTTEARITTSEAQPDTTEARTTTSEAQPDTTEARQPDTTEARITTSKAQPDTTQARTTTIEAQPDTTQARTTTIDTNEARVTTTEAQPDTTEAHATTTEATTHERFPTSQQTMTPAGSASTPYHPSATRTMLYEHLTTEQIAIESSEELKQVLAALQKNIEIPANATEQETVQLIQDYSETAIKLIFQTSPDETDTSTTQANPAELTEGTEALLGNLASNLPPGGSIKVATETVVAEVRSFISNGTQHMASFSVAGGRTSTKAALDVPLDKLNKINGTITVTVIYVDHSIVGSSNVSLESRSSNRERQDNNTETTVRLASGILSSTVYVDGNQFNVDPKLTVEYNKKVPESKQAFRTESETICAFWNAKASTWSTKGCEKVSQIDVQVTCYCNHTTSYAILLQVTNYPIPEIHSDLMTYLTNFGCVLSVLSLSMSFILFMIFESLRTAEHFIIHSNFAVALLAAQLSFLLGADQTSNETLCKITAMTIHYLYMCVFCWMLVEGINLYIKIVLVFNTEKSKLLYYVLLGWGVPIVIVAVCAGVAWDQYATENSCWIESGSPLMWGFAGPAAFIILLNMILLCIVARILYRSIRSIDKEGSDNLKASWIATKGTLTLTPLLGITWIFGFMAVGGATLVFQYIFVVLNSLQGVFFFIFFCFLNKEVREKVKRLSEKTKLSSAQFSSSSVAPEKPLMTGARPAKNQVDVKPIKSEEKPVEMNQVMWKTVDTMLQGNDRNDEDGLKNTKQVCK
ncbi:uncharacterized protein [Amphiura filiformis]|uniref:uncharacterized protein n=1 Tax=Amphiura filiformis TaxID=82378 RepID=UPI003B21A5CA